MAVGEAGGDSSGAPDDGPGEVQQSDVAVKGEGVEVRMNEDLVNLYQLLTWIRTLLIKVSCTQRHYSSVHMSMIQNCSGSIQLTLPLPSLAPPSSILKYKY